MKKIVFNALLLVSAALLVNSCNIFGPDGDSSSTLTSTDGYFYMFDRNTRNLYQLDVQMHQLNVWNVNELTDDSFVQGITFDGEHIWIAASGTARSLFKLDLTGDEPVAIQTIQAPPGGSGTVRDIGFDGNYLWVANSGSVSLNNPPALYKVNPETGVVENEYQMPFAEARSVSFIPPNGDQYGRGAASGVYIGDIENNKFWNFRPDRPVFADAFDAPEPPTGQFTINPVGLTYEIMANGEIKFWTVNSSLSTNYLFKLSRTGSVEERFELNQYVSPGPIVFAPIDVTIPAPPEITSVVPNKGALNTTTDVVINGGGFIDGSGLEADFGADISVASLQYESSGKLTAEITISGDAQIGYHSVSVTNPDGQTATLENAFEVTATPPLFGFLYVLDFDDNWLYKLREADGGLEQEWNTQEMAAAGSPQGITYDGEYFWLASAGSDRALIQFEIDGANLNEIKRINAPYPTGSGTVRGIYYDSGTIWALNSGDNKLYKIDAEFDEIVDEFDSPGLETRGVTMANGVIYVTDRDLGRVYSLDESTGDWEIEFEVPLPEGVPDSHRWPIGLDYDGENFWIVVSRFASDFVLEVTPGGQLLRTIESPRIGPDILSDVVYVEEEQ